MEININKDIREYTEGIFFGLNQRQLLCSGMAIGAAVAVYFLTKDVISSEFITYICMAVAAPFAALGFVKYNGMPMEKLAVVWFRDNFLCPRRLTFRANNFYREVTRDYLDHLVKEGLKEHAEELKHDTEAG